MSALMQNTDTSEPALIPDGNLTLVDDVVHLRKAESNSLLPLPKTETTSISSLTVMIRARKPCIF